MMREFGFLNCFLLSMIGLEEGRELIGEGTWDFKNAFVKV
jgi:hypothetical protein